MQSSPSINLMPAECRGYKVRTHAFRMRCAGKRDGSYLSASCGLEEGRIVVHPYTEGFVRPERLRNGVDADVVGQIVAVIRSLPSLP